MVLYCRCNKSTASTAYGEVSRTREARWRYAPYCVGDTELVGSPTRETPWRCGARGSAETLAVFVLYGTPQSVLCLRFVWSLQCLVGLVSNRAVARLSAGAAMPRAAQRAGASAHRGDPGARPINLQGAARRNRAVINPQTNIAATPWARPCGFLRMFARPLVKLHTRVWERAASGPIIIVFVVQTVQRVCKLYSIIIVYVVQTVQTCVQQRITYFGPTMHAARLCRRLKRAGNNQSAIANKQRITCFGPT